jgi:pimeloyl-ACP methyl ester carboxylesterase
MNQLVVEQIGEGEPVVLVHGSIVGARATWSRQLPLAERWSLMLVDRPGFGANPHLDGRVDYELDGALVAGLLSELGGAHLIGHSYGGLVAMFAAATAAPSVQSLTLIEPPAFPLVADDPTVGPYIDGFKALWRDPPRTRAQFLRQFLALVGANELPDPLPADLLRGAELLEDERHVWEAQIPSERLRSAKFGKLVVSGGHESALEVLCDALQIELGSERATVAGAGHSVQRTGEPFNQLVEEFLRSASTRYLAASSR